jgi:hypothetical protein
MIQSFLKPGKNQIWESRCSNRFPPTHPVHGLTEAVQERVDTEGLATKPSPTQTARMRSLLLLLEHKHSCPSSRFGTRGEQSKVSHCVLSPIRDMLDQNVDKLLGCIPLSNKLLISRILRQVLDLIYRKIKKSCVLLRMKTTRSMETSCREATRRYEEIRRGADAWQRFTRTANGLCLPRGTRALLER